jgi:hypothetical protein
MQTLASYSIKASDEMKAVSRYQEAPLEESNPVDWRFLVIAWLIMNAVWLVYCVTT